MALLKTSKELQNESLMNDVNQIWRVGVISLRTNVNDAMVNSCVGEGDSEDGSW